MRKVYLLVLLIIASFSIATAQHLVKISGTIKDRQNSPLSKVTISVLGQQQATTTDENGFYNIYSNSKTFTIKFYLLGYKVVVVNFKEKEGARITKNIELLENANELDQVDISSKENQLSNAVTLNLSDLSSFPSSSGNFESILKTLPGVSTNNELSSQYSVRGGNFDENLIYVNDIEINRPVLIRNAQQEGLSFVNGDLATRVKFSAGGFGAKYGDKLSSVLDVRYDAPDSNQLTVTAGLLGASITAKSLFKKSYLLAGLRYKNNSGLLNTQDIAGSYSPNFTDAQVIYQYNFTPKFSINVLGNLNAGKFRLLPEDRETQFGTLNTILRLKVDYEGQEIDTYRTYGGAVSALFTPNPNLVFKWINSYFNTIERERFDIDGSYIFEEVNDDFGQGFGTVKSNRGIGSYFNYARNSLNSKNFGSEIRVEQNLNHHVLSAGVKVEQNEYSDSMYEYSYIDSAGYILPNNGKIFMLNPIATNNYLQIRNLNGYVQDSYQLSSYADLQIGSRISYNDLSKEVLISPRVLFAYRPASNNKILRLTAGIYRQAPSYRSIRNFDGILNLNQLSQRSYNASVGYDYAFSGLGTRLKFTSEFYFKYADRMIPYVVDNVRIRYLADQVAKGYTYGADFSIGGEFVKDLVSYFRISYMQANQDIIGDSYMKKDASGNLKSFEPDYLKRPTDQRINFSIFFQDRLLKSPTYKVHLNLLYGSRLPTGSPYVDHYSDDFSIPAYRRVDIGFSKDFLDDNAVRKPKLLKRYFSSFTAYAEVFNLLNINNTVSYLWLKNVDNVSYAVPNYLTARQVNVKLILKFKNH